jgi:DNA-directed RNA polymerase specialized sigma24 family protein
MAHSIHPCRQILHTLRGPRVAPPLLSAGGVLLGPWRVQESKRRELVRAYDQRGSPMEEPTWKLTEHAFDGLLARLDSDRNKAAAEYEKLRRKLVNFFDWRGSVSPDAHADETLDRVARRLEEGEDVEHVPRYVYGVARRVLQEWDRRQRREQAAIPELRARLHQQVAAADADRRLACLKRCLEQLPEDERALILGYYQKPEGSPLQARKLFAQQLGIAYGTLKTRAHRARVRLEACLHDCLAEAGDAVGQPAQRGSMTPATETAQAEALIGYLLGTMSPDEQERIEERYFTDDDAYEELLATSDDLIHGYLVGALSDTEQRLFEAHFLASPWRRERLQPMRDLLALVQSASPRRGAAPRAGAIPPGRWLAWPAAAAALLALGIGALWLRGPGRDAERAARNPQPVASPALPAATGASPTARPVSRVQAVRVPRGATGPVEVALSAPVRSVRVELDVERGSRSYDAELARDGRSVWRGEELTPPKPDALLSVSIPAEVFEAEGEYVLSVAGEALRAQPRPPRVVSLRVVRH